MLKKCILVLLNLDYLELNILTFNTIRCTWICNIYPNEWDVICVRLGSILFCIQVEYASAGMWSLTISVYMCIVLIITNMVVHCS